LIEARDALIVAYKLAILTFYLGVLIYALPLPWRPLKKWGPQLLWDGVTAALLAALFYTLIEASNWIAAILGGSWRFFENWVGNSLTTLVSLKKAILVIQVVLSRVGLWQAAKTIVSPLDRVVEVSLFTVLWVAGIAYFVKKFGLYLAAIGVALYAVPLRMTRSAGAWLLAFYIVANAGFQVMPSFMATIAEAPGRPDPGIIEEYGLAAASVNIMFFNGTRPDGVLYMSVEGRNEPLAILEVVGGSVRDPALEPLVAIPSRAPVYYKLEVDGLIVLLHPYPAKPQDYSIGEDGVWKITLRNRNIVWLGNYVIAYSVSGIIRAYQDGDSYIVRVKASEGKEFGVRWPSKCAVTVAVDPPLEGRFIEWEWLEVKGYGMVYEAPEGEYTLNITVYDCGEVEPKVRKYSYLNWVANFGSFTDLNFIAAVILYYTTIPFLYVFLILSVTTALSRVLGGRERFPVKL